MSAAPARRVLFGSSQDRKIFPCHFAPDRLGIQEKREETPDLGPGCYDNHEFNTIIYNLRKRPESKRGYVLSARTAVRFPPLNKKTMTPSPQQYQPDQSQSRVSPPGRAPFMSNTHRFKKTSHSADDSPGPGTYAQDSVTNRKVSWPMCFGRPDWSRLPQLEKRALRVKLTSDEEFIKHRSRLAYLSMYY
ncbi:protein pitchfork-like isoform X2 [Girardinichthys multiradiatus]|uniref:protein pitchfork-like isoform X2 n=1 Tax=Girardinichthys multiradiatus TaxID=208333 RepID=UPI001FAE4857|nr:protein pitchfork-like isoform X2 [Girardinichthys multiradiatus]